MVAAVLLASCSSSSHQGSAPTTAVPSPSTTAVPAGPSIVSAPVQVARTSDGNVGYRTLGTGPPLVLIMGFSGTMDDWEPTFVDQLAAHHRVVTFDNAGIGRTSALPLPLTASAMADQTSALITALGLGRTDVLGWSMGGMIAQALALRHPDQVSHLVLSATLPGDGHATVPPASAVAALNNPANVAGFLALLFPSGQTAASQSFIEGILSYPGYYQAAPAAIAAQEGVLADWVGGHDATGLRLAAIAAPTLVADGAGDPLDPVPNDQHLASTIPHATLVIYPGAAHAFLFQDAASFLPRLEQFVGSG